MKACVTLHAETGICVFLNWENGIWVTGTGMKAPKIGMGNPITIIKTAVVVGLFRVK
jgi:hypothetical protein